MHNIGAHMSISGGLQKAFDQAKKVNATALQIFTKNQRQWKIPPLTEKIKQDFFAAWNSWGNYPVIAHDSYLINLATNKPEGLEKSIHGFTEELRRCEELKIPGLVTHPGSHLGQGIETGIERYTRHLDQCIEESGTQNVMVLLETTAGQGSNLGSTFEELAAIIAASKYPDRLGVCYDTCHTFAAGYDIRTPEAYKATFDAFDRIIGLDRLRFFHLNDSKTPLGAGKDRHEHIGQGEIGESGFALLMRDDRFLSVPMSLETDKGDDLEEDRMNLATLRRLAGED